MKKVSILYNQSAGGGDHNPEELINRFSGQGTSVELAYTDESDWKKSLNNSPDLIVVAGGDGTVHQVVLEIVKGGVDIPTLVLPLGTANNISIALGDLKKQAGKGPKEFIMFDAGRISGLGEPKYFFESMGFGVFPKYIRTIKDEKNKEEIKRNVSEIIRLFLKVVDDYSPGKTVIKVDGVKLKGKFLLVQLFNIKLIGPNLNLAPRSVPDDGYFDLGLIPSKRKAEFKEYLSRLSAQKALPEELENFFIRLKCKKVELKSKDSNLHIDDSLVDYSGEKIIIKIIPARIKFLQE